MIDIDAAITVELEHVVSIAGAPDWNAVVHAAGLSNRRRRGRSLFAAAVVAVTAGVIAVTPLGAAIGRGFGGFSDWLTGNPGTPASQAVQDRFSASNAHSWLGFPKGTQLRHLATRRIGGETITLYGFRSGSSLCLQLTVRGSTRGQTTDCAPLADLQRRDAPARVLIADHAFGISKKYVWYGIDRLHAPLLQVTAGVVADDVQRVLVKDEHSRHSVAVTSDAFLYVASRPAIGQRVERVWAQSGRRLLSVPYVPTPFGGLGGGGSKPKPAPSVPVTAPTRGGRVAWLDQRQLRGEPMSVLPARIRSELLGYRGGLTHDRIVFARVLTPDPSRPLRVVLTLNAHRHGRAVAGICITTVGSDEAGGGCSPYPGIFAKTPIQVGEFYNGAQQFEDASGVVSDAVTRLRALLANGQWLDVPLADNAFAVQLPLARLPARLVGYNDQHQVVGLSHPIQGLSSPGPTQAPGKAVQLLAVRGPNGSSEELLVGPATGGGECMYIKHYFSKHANGVMEGCNSRSWSGSPLQLSTDEFPPLFIGGRVRPDVAAVRVVYANNTTSLIRPTRGYVLALVEAHHRTKATRPVRFEGLSSTGRNLGVENLPPPPKGAP